MKTGEQCPFCGQPHPAHRVGCVWGGANLLLETEIRGHRMMTMSPVMLAAINIIATLGARGERDLRDPKYDGIFATAKNIVALVEGT